MRYALVLAGLVACGKGATVAKISGTATVGGKPAKIVGCTIETLPDPDRAGVVITLDTGLKYRHDPYAGPTMAKGGDWEKVTCDKMKSSASGSSDWAQGTLSVSCTYGGTPIAIEATYDCGAVDRPSNLKD